MATPHSDSASSAASSIPDDGNVGTLCFPRPPASEAKKKKNVKQMSSRVCKHSQNPTPAFMLWEHKFWRDVAAKGLEIS